MVDPDGIGELGAGEVFAGYRIERRLGRGGMGILYLAVEPGLERRVALKLIAPEAANEGVFARRFEEESRIAAAIEHPNVVPIYAAGKEGGVAYIAMRYVAGSDLGRRVAREGRLDPGRAVELIGQVAAGLDAIHAAGLVHRDVKPANVLLSGEEGSEHAYITDFGVARNVATASGLTQTGRFVGTLDYVAPEQISGQRVDARVDVYALGCLLHKLLTGEVPFPREAEAARLYAHLNDPPPRPSLQATAVPPALDEVLARALAKQPADRYPSAGDLGRAAAAAIAGTPVSVPERTVATGAAATVETETVAPTAESAAPAPDPPPEAGPERREPFAVTPDDADPDDPDRTTEAETGRLGPGPPEAPTEPRAGGPKRNPVAIGAAAAAVLAIGAVGLILALGGGGDGGAAATTTSERTQASTQEQTTPAPEPDPEPQPLTRAELIAAADRSCETARDEYVAAKDASPEAETEAGMSEEFARTLVGISGKQVRTMEGLDAPAAVEPAWSEYLASRQEVALLDQDALRAARQEDAAAYLAAYEQRNETEAQREALADEIGFEVCSGGSG